MKFEKLNENKIKIFLNIKDLAEKNIDFHVFMSNTIESQDILLDMLEQAKMQTGFDPEDYNLKIEALCLADSSFIFTITKIVPDLEISKGAIKAPKKNFKVKRKNNIPSTSQAIYSFSDFEDFCNFLSYLKTSNLVDVVNNIAESIVLYSYKQKYYLLIDNINQAIVNKLKFYTIITEFASYVINSNMFMGKLKECGSVVIYNNALEVGFNYFV